MTPAEFKAWFDGFTEAFDRLPTKAQWARVKERVAEIDGRAVTERQFIDRYHSYDWRWRRPLQPWTNDWSHLWAASCSTQSPSGAAQAQLGGSALWNGADKHNSSNAMYALGKADSASLTA